MDQAHGIAGELWFGYWKNILEHFYSMNWVRQNNKI